MMQFRVQGFGGQASVDSPLGSQSVKRRLGGSRYPAPADYIPSSHMFIHPPCISAKHEHSQHSEEITTFLMENVVLSSGNWAEASPCFDRLYSVCTGTYPMFHGGLILALWVPDAPNENHCKAGERLRETGQSTAVRALVLICAADS